MGLERSYKAFFGFEISKSGSMFNSRACISFSKEHFSEGNDRASGGRKTFRKQIQAYRKHRESTEFKSSNDLIQDAEFEIISEEEELSDKRKADIRTSHKEPGFDTISNSVETYLNGKDRVSKGCRLDYRV